MSHAQAGQQRAGEQSALVLRPDIMSSSSSHHNHHHHNHHHYHHAASPADVEWRLAPLILAVQRVPGRGRHAARAGVHPEHAGCNTETLLVIRCYIPVAHSNSGSGPWDGEAAVLSH